MTKCRALVATAVVFALVLAAGGAALILFLAEDGRNQQTTTLQQGCLRQAQRNVVLVNLFRAQATASHIVARDPRQPSETRRARAREVTALLRGIAIIDRQTDISVAAELVNETDQVAVERADFSCVRVYPKGGLLP